MNQHVKNMLYNHQVSIDPEMIWSGIQQKQKRKGLMYWLMSSIGLVILVVVVWLVGHFGFVRSQEKLPSPDSSQAMAYVSHEENSAKDESATEKMDIIEIVEEKYDTAPLISKELKSLERTSKVLLQRETISQAKPKLSAIPVNEVEPTKNIINNIAEWNEGDETQSRDIVPLTVKKSYTDKLSIDKLIIEEFLTIDALDFSLLEYNRPYKKLNRSNRQSCYAFGKQRHPWSLYVYGGPSILLKNLSTKVEENETYLSQRQSSENALESWRAGAQLKYKWDNGFYVKAGIEMNRLNEQLAFTNMRDSMYVLTDQVIRIIIDSAGDTTEVLGDVTVTETTTEDWVIYNKYQFVNIPLHVGYIKSKNRWSFAGEVGLHINVSFSFDGQLLTPTGQPIQDPSYFKTNAGSAISLTGGVGYQVLPRARFWLTPSYMKLLRPINIDAYPIDQEYSTMGLLAGIEFKF